MCATIGLYLSYWLDAAPGGLVVVTQGAAFTLVYLFGPRGLLARFRRSTTKPVVDAVAHGDRF